jgi:catechol 2,3-dioxygenase-like lactoylglutathione lyase family enzyme
VSLLGAAKIQTFVPTVDAVRSRAFYEGVLGLRFVADDSFALVFELEGAQLRIQKVREFTPHPFTSLGWMVADIEAAVRELGRRGVAFERYGFAEQDALGIWTTPGARVAWFKDPDGNLLSVAQLG